MSLVEIKYIIFLDNCTQEYKKILVTNILPTNVTFKGIIKTISIPKLSIFDSTSTTCTYAIVNPNSKSELLELKDIGILFNFLTENSLNLHSAFSEVIKQDKFICYVS